MDKRLSAKLDQAKGVTVHKDKLRIAFRLAGDKVQTKRSLGIEPTSRNIDFAINKLGEIKMDIMRGTFTWDRHFPNDPKAKIAYGISLREALNRYYLDLGSWKRSTRHCNEYTASSMLRDFGPEVNLKNITLDSLREYEQILTKNSSLQRVKYKLYILKLVMERALRDGVIDSTPFSSFELAVKTTGDKLDEEAQLSELDVYTIAEANMIIGWHKNQPHEANLLQFLFWSGARHGEVAALKWSDYDRHNRYVDILRTNTLFRGVTQTPKTGKARRVYLPLLAIEALERQREITAGSEHIFCSQQSQRPFHNRNIINYPRWTTRVNDLGLRRLTPYVTRHCFASWMLRAGENMMDIANALGHSDMSMLQTVYGHFIPQDRHKWTMDDPLNRNE